ncbi:MAG: hypothetical protein IPK83_07260 [Planctomycetes bacterium]|nr:hypothetical protein [Planctomycetota bacterium]
MYGRLTKREAKQDRRAELLGHVGFVVEDLEFVFLIDDVVRGCADFDALGDFQRFRHGQHALTEALGIGHERSGVLLEHGRKGVCECGGHFW